MSDFYSLINEKSHFLFDFDGVVMDSEIAKFGCYKQAIKEINELEIDPQKMAWSGLKENEVVHFFENVYKCELDAEKIIFRKRELYQKLVDTNEVAFVKGIENFTDRLKMIGKSISLVTASTKVEVKEVLKNRSDFLDRFDQTIFKDDVSNKKPHPEPYLKCMEKLNVFPEDVLIFEDSPIGMEAAAAAECDFVRVLSSAHGEVEKGLEILRIGNFEEASNLLNN